MPKILGSDLYFPPLHHSTPDGLLAVGGDLGLERLVLAYSKGIYPWYSDDTPILWWAPPERCILPLDIHMHDEAPEEKETARENATLEPLQDNVQFGLKISHRLARKYKSFTHTINKSFSEVIELCAQVPRPGQQGTWLIREMQEAYIHLHESGFAHSVECWQENKLVGGLYGVALGKAFFGESMFHLTSDGSKMALMTLVQTLRAHDFKLLDCQQVTPHMLRMGAHVVTREEFSLLLKRALDAGGGGLSSLANRSLRGKVLAEKLPLFP